MTYTGSTPIWRRNPTTSFSAHFSASFPPAIRWIVIDVIRRSLPVLGAPRQVSFVLSKGSETRDDFVSLRDLFFDPVISGCGLRKNSEGLLQSLPAGKEARERRRIVVDVVSPPPAHPSRSDFRCQSLRRTSAREAYFARVTITLPLLQDRPRSKPVSLCLHWRPTADLERGPRPAFDRSQGLMQRIGYLCLREASEVSQFQNALLLFIESGEGGLDSPPLIDKRLSSMPSVVSPGRLLPSVAACV